MALIDWARRAIEARSDYLDARLVLVASLSLAGRNKDAALACDECHDLEPVGGDTWASNWFYLDVEQLDVLRKALTKAGFKD